MIKQNYTPSSLRRVWLITAGYVGGESLYVVGNEVLANHIAAEIIYREQISKAPPDVDVSEFMDAYNSGGWFMCYHWWRCYGWGEWRITVDDEPVMHEFLM